MASTFSRKVVQKGLRNVSDETTTQKALVEFSRLANEEEASKPEPPETEPKLNMVLFREGTTEAAWIIAHNESIPPQCVADRIREAILEFNTSRKGRSNPVVELFEGLEVVPAKYFKGYGIVVRTKLPVSTAEAKPELGLPASSQAA